MSDASAIWLPGVPQAPSARTLASWTEPATTTNCLSSVPRRTSACRSARRRPGGRGPPYRHPRRPSPRPSVARLTKSRRRGATLLSPGSRTTVTCRTVCGSALAARFHRPRRRASRAEAGGSGISRHCSYISIFMQTIDSLPGPKPLPVLGNLPALGRSRALGRLLDRWCDEYGTTYRVWRGRRRFHRRIDLHAEVHARRHRLAGDGRRPRLAARRRRWCPQ
jgi:hypothetical protein